MLNSATQSRKGAGVDLKTFHEHFEKLSKANEDPAAPEDFGLDSDNAGINQDFTADELRELINKLKNGKACGPDSVHNEFLKCCPDDLLEILARLFNLILSTGHVPDEWCVCTILPPV